MRSFLVVKGLLTASIGEGFLSAYEISVLKPGDIVNSLKQASEGCSVYFNGHHIVTGEVVVIDDIYCVRVTSFLPPKSSIGVFTNVEAPVEMLPFSIQLGSIEIALSELNRVEIDSLLSLDVSYSDEADAELLVAGIPVGRGKVGVTYENMNLRVTEVYGNNTKATNIEVRSSGNLLEREYSTKFSKDYDFKRPEKFGRGSLDRIKSIHELFAQNLRMKYAVYGEYKLDVGQSTYRELLGNVNVENYLFQLILNLPWPRKMRVDERARTHLSSTHSKYLVEPEHPKYRISEETRVFIRKFFEGDGVYNRAHTNGVFLFIRKNEKVSTLVENDNRRDFVLSALRGSWKNIVDINFQFPANPGETKSEQLLPASEMVLTVKISDSTHPESQIVIIYPYITLEPYIGILNS